MYKDYNHLSHTVWECKYHIVFIPKYRKKRIYKWIRKDLRDILYELARQKGCIIEEGSLMSDHVHMLISIPPKYAVSQVVGFLKGKSAIALARIFENRSRNFTGKHFWARGYSVSTIGYDEEAIKKYIRNQEEVDKKRDQRNLFES